MMDAWVMLCIVAEKSKDHAIDIAIFLFWFALLYWITGVVPYGPHS